MISTKKVDGGAKVKVTFTLPADAQADSGDGDVLVLGDFNGWDRGVKLRRRGDKRSASVVVDPGRRYAFRYRRSDGVWFNDDQSDQEPNGFGDTNNVIDLTGPR